MPLTQNQRVAILLTVFVMTAVLGGGYIIRVFPEKFPELTLKIETTVTRTFAKALCV